MQMQKCRLCLKHKSLDQFYFRSDSQTFRSECKECNAMLNSKRRERNREVNSNKQEFIGQKHCYGCDETKDLELFSNNRTKGDGKGCLCLECDRQYQARYRDKDREAHRKRARDRRRKDPERHKEKDNRRYQAQKLRRILSVAVRYALLSNNLEKGQLSTVDILPDSIEDIKVRIELLFEWWMHWDNWGTYDPTTWDDNDPTTWKWQLDHIDSQAKLPFSSIDDPNFRMCWGIDNLRPLSAKQNVLDGDRRTDEEVALIKRSIRTIVENSKGDNECQQQQINQ